MAQDHLTENAIQVAQRMEQLESQLVDLQSQVAFQEDTISALNNALTLQQGDIDQLRALSKHFKQELERVLTSIDGATDGGAGTEPPPPHY